MKCYNTENMHGETYGALTEKVCYDKQPRGVDLDPKEKFLTSF